jgi:hypothetical protein
MAIKISYLEPSEPQREELCGGIRDLFAAAGFESVVSIAQDADQVKDSILSGHCDVFVCDLSLNRTSSTSFEGMSIVADIKRRFPYVFTIGITGGYPSYNLIDVTEPSFDLFLPKLVVTARPPNFGGAPNYVQRLLDRFRALPNVTVKLASEPPETQDGRKLARTEVEILVRQLFSAVGPPSQGSYPSEVTLTPLSGGRSASHVFIMNGYRPSTGKHYLTSVLKISSVEDFRQELERYRKYVQWSLPYTARVDVLGTASTQESGAIAYSVAHGGTRVFETLTAMLERNDTKKSLVAINAVLNAADQLWGEIPRPSGESTIGSRYFERYFASQHEWFEKNSTAMQDAIRQAGHSIELERDCLRVDGLQYPNVLKVLRGNGAFDSVWSICHGDMNTSNVIVTSDGSIALIDFRDAGIGQISEDFITLEGCIRMYWKWTNTLGSADLLQACIAQERKFNGTKMVPGRAPAWRLVKTVRDHAMRKHGRNGEKSYLFGLAYYCFRLLRLSGLNPGVVTRLTATMLAACMDLEEVA